MLWLVFTYGVKCEFYACFVSATLTSRGVIPSPPGIAWPGCLTTPHSERSTLIAWSVIQFDIWTKLIYQRVPAILVQCMWQIIPYWYWLTCRTRRGIFSRLIVTVTQILARCNCHAVGQDGKLTISLGGHSDTRWNGIFRAVSFPFSFSHYRTQALTLSRILGGLNNWCRIFTQYLAAILIICTSAALVNNGSLYSTTSPLVISMSVYWSKGWI